jgi:hypothetical protein
MPFQKIFFLLLEDIFFNKLTSFLYEAAETAYWDLKDRPEDIWFGKS